MRSLRRGWASPPLQGQALGRLKKWVRFASIFSALVAPPLSSPLGLRGCFTFVQPPFGATAYPIMEIDKNINFLDFLRIKIIF